MARTIVVFGASGTIGQGFIKNYLDNEGGNVKIVGVFRSEESAKKVSARLGNPSGDKFVSLVGKVDSEENAAKLQKATLAKVGSITDVVVTIGAFAWKTPLLEQTVEELRDDIFSGKFEPNFLVAKYFLPLIQDREGTSFTFINGAAAYQPVPKFGHVTIANSVLLKLSEVLKAELKDKPVRINDFVIACFVTPWDNPTVPPGINFPTVDNIKMGKALLGVVVHPTSRGAAITVSPDVLDKLAQTGAV